MNAPNVKIHPAAQPQVSAKRYAIVLAGGSGTRLWPLSRSSKPKQLLCLNGEESLLQQTVRRVLPMVDASHVATVTSAEYRFEVAGQLLALDAALAGGVLAEPMGRNTLPAIAWAVARIARETPDALIGVFSSDHAVANDEAFLRAWQSAEAAAKEGYVALFGMQPTEAATGYGYIQSGKPLAGANSGPLSEVHQAARFVEKPDLATAQGYLTEGGYYWNGGMFVFRADRFMEMVKQHQPQIFAATQALAEKNEVQAAADVYASMPDLSIDYGLLELADNVAVVPVDMGWSDLGSWESIYQQRGKDAQGNMLEGDVLAIDSQDNLLWSEHGLVATLGVANLAVVQTRDATLICPRERVQDLKQLVAAVKESHAHLTEIHLTVTRPWGSYTILEEGPGYKIKRILVNPGAKLSMQMHFHRSEHWVVIDGTARITNGEQDIYLEENQSTYIPKTNRHRLENPGKVALQIIEIQSGPYLEEDDIVRFDDVYGRIPG
ncbi:MAG: mannose-1-phosphate guanylyltransferase/mannose-6-phosphate isomerase [Burkholderiales bacterium]|nr:mannose-1-phosphate guanylyltransferase/mannose-6-phosphate isomerase [Burkholderiales bacterium]